MINTPLQLQRKKLQTEQVLPLVPYRGTRLWPVLETAIGDGAYVLIFSAEAIVYPVLPR